MRKYCALCTFLLFFTMAPCLSAHNSAQENSPLDRAQAYFDSGDWVKSEQIMRDLLSKGSDVKAELAYGAMLRHRGRFTESLIQFQRSFERYPDVQLAHGYLLNAYVILGRFSEARELFERVIAEKGFDFMFGTEAYFIALAADGRMQEARNFAARQGFAPLVRMRFDFYLNRIDKDPDAGKKLIVATLAEIKESGKVRYAQVENLLMAGDLEKARYYASNIPKTLNLKMMLYLSDEVDQRCLAFYPDMLPLLNDLPKVRENFLKNGRNLEVDAMQKEVGGEL
ncbi:tetratricopeptide repeat protein [Porticoccus sp. W117]|uniref:tetratricopeptide repeat protein n=1 Tax=Porticoccus sp. W117 TaxID=3054777 RepID=UPI0025945CDC|nr:tetratricopeptide repeat protein [Porticoccus sp. W117]MDM3869751.1 tetratricopeptide repeat protein [Porticoccus sp. W117]